MNHLVIAPIVLPLLAGVLLVFMTSAPLASRRAANLIATTALLLLGIGLLWLSADGAHRVYELGDWPAPFGIVLVLDRLSAFMVCLTGIVALASLLFAVQGWDGRGKNFHPLFQLQLLGLNIAFLTGDAFNLFVAFEVMLIASYGLLLHGGGRARTRAGFHYVVINLIGSSLFLLGVGLLYAVTGTLNMADLAVQAAVVSPEDAFLLKAGGLLLMLVFAVKAALLPLYFWLPGAYSAASAPVAAIFAIMTKVGAYAIIRVSVLVFGPQAGEAADLLAPYLLPVALATHVAGMVGALAADTLRRQVAYLVVASMGTLLAAVGLYSGEGLDAALYYLPHGTLVICALFMLADLVGMQRGELDDRLQAGRALAQPALLGVLYFALAIAVIGLPPLSGFIGKVLIMNAALDSSALAWVWAVLLGGGLLGIIGMGRAGSQIFWKSGDVEAAADTPRVGLGHALPVAAVLTLLAALTVLAGPFGELTAATAAQVMDTGAYVDAVLGTPGALEARELLSAGENAR
ncbi:monovalent cation/H+ antiporter subunit D [Alkalilimnicola sp. S0819]|uniref:monovalent cation/H+ antiporter subunit D n=1 Tax=Alkalilimnicola sp. S0819 TaxID=2613922 RepID=UPI001261BD9D|nr:monovalent cation/H+ antiporter subunit D [Alkalilimnicola sp. S0819]KAB7623164.1 monovalent cation/H+ antiporter subunit D [Alkalilimnicola sp. S0819]MPQ17008.1 monovalent cation/H+ antiporter subunit D [Alkalilimnicola sp. S0819]